MVISFGESEILPFGSYYRFQKLNPGIDGHYETARIISLLYGNFLKMILNNVDPKSDEGIFLEERNGVFIKGSPSYLRCFFSPNIDDGKAQERRLGRNQGP